MTSSLDTSVDIIEISDSENETKATLKQITSTPNNPTLDYAQAENRLLKSQLYDTEKLCRSYERQIRKARGEIRVAEAAQFSSGNKLKAMRKEKSSAELMQAKLKDELSCQICTSYMSGQPHNPVAMIPCGHTPYELTSSARIWPPAMNTMLGGDANEVYLVFADMKQRNGSRFRRRIHANTTYSVS
ncbi:hypothetical protein PQX77_002008 [Marasmius sp. AFHP31]|nr:hypothetical protein PQX77_002008 [Marasmius sp. AFHP31]